MAFVTLPFIAFITLTALLYFTVPKKGQWIVLLVASYVFFWLNSQFLILALMAATAATFYVGQWIGREIQRGKEALKSRPDLTQAEKKQFRAQTKKKTKRILVLGILLDLSLLVGLKYADLFSTGANLVLSRFGYSFPRLRFLLPIGISFYTLQAISYLVDIYRGKVEPDRNLAKFMLFMSYFPQIVQGPIPRYKQLAQQLYDSHPFDYQRVTFGIQLMLWGFFKKLVIADRMGIAVKYIFGNIPQFHGLMALAGAAFYGIQLYGDFSGGIDIARGLSQVFGIELADNFKQPYFSRSIEEFWRRWHISLGEWMKDYIFYPLSLSKPFLNLSKKTRKVFGEYFGKRLPSFLATFIVFVLVGVWHGPQLKYFAYGIINGGIIVSSFLLEKVYARIKKAARIEETSLGWRVFQMVRTFVVISFARMFDRGDGIRLAVKMLTSVFKKWWDLSFLVDGTLTKTGLVTADWVLLIFAVTLVWAVDLLHEKNVSIREGIARQHIVLRWLIYYGAIFIILIFGVWGPAYSKAGFMYEQF